MGICLTLPVFGAAPPAAADNTRGFYFGGGVGATWLSVYDDDYNNNDCCYYYGNYDYETSDSTPSFTLFGGYRFARYVAAEVGYFYSDNLNGMKILSTSMS